MTSPEVSSGEVLSGEVLSWNRFLSVFYKEKKEVVCGQKYATGVDRTGGGRKVHESQLISSYHIIAQICLMVPEWPQNGHLTNFL